MADDDSPPRQAAKSKRSSAEGESQMIGEAADGGLAPSKQTIGEAADGGLAPSKQTSSAAKDELPDELPDDLQPSLVDPEDYVFPNNNRRRVPGFLYLGIAGGLIALYLVRGEGVLVNRGLLMAAAILAIVGLYSIVAGWNLDVDERDALKVSINEVGFPVGHASAQMGWRGLLSRPTWRILLYSAEEPPLKRGLVLVDGVDGAVVEALVEDNPEDWSDVVDGERIPKGTTADE